MQTSILGKGYVTANQAHSVVFRPFFSGLRIYIDHQPALTLPFGGYVKDEEEGLRRIKSFCPGMLPCANSRSRASHS
jgi:hypothetical protein